MTIIIVLSDKAYSKLTSLNFLALQYLSQPLYIVHNILYMNLMCQHTPHIYISPKTDIIEFKCLYNNNNNNDDAHI